MLGDLGSSLDIREVEGSFGGGWAVLFLMVSLIWKWVVFGFGIWEWIPLFWSVAPVRALSVIDVG